MSYTPGPAGLTLEQFKRSGDVDDTASFLRAMDYFKGPGSGSQAGGTLNLRGGYTISDTILISSLGITLKGDGWGNSTHPTSGTWIKWNGAAGKPMVKLLQTFNAGLDNIRLIGNSAAKPSCGIEFADQATDSFYANYLNRVWIGNLYGYDSDNAVQFQNGIICSGTINGDSNTFSHVRIFGCSNIGFDIQNPNFACTGCHGLFITFCAIGLKINGSIYGVNWFFGNHSDTCFRLLSGSRVYVTGFESESSARLATLDDLYANGKFVLHGGAFQVETASIAADGRYIDTGIGNGWSIHLEDFSQQMETGYSGPVPKIRACNSSGGLTFGTLRMIGTRGIYPVNLETGSLIWSNDARNIFYEPVADFGQDAMPKMFWQGNWAASDTQFKVFASDSPGQFTQRGGPFTVERLNLPIVSVTTLTGSGATTYSYKVTAVCYDGESVASAAGTCTNAATLDSTHVNRISWHPVPGAYAYKVYGRIAGSELLLKTVTWENLQTVFGPPQWDDNGSLAPAGASPPTANTTGNLVVGGKITLGTTTAPSAPANGDMWFDGAALKIRIAGVTKTVTVT